VAQRLTRLPGQAAVAAAAAARKRAPHAGRRVTPRRRRPARRAPAPPPGAPPRAHQATTLISARRPRSGPHTIPRTALAPNPWVKEAPVAPGAAPPLCPPLGPEVLDVWGAADAWLLGGGDAKVG
jgi:hypothetical protein